MSAKTELLLDCIGRARDAYSALEVAKSDCEDAVDAEIDALVAACDEKISATDKKNIKKIAKAVAANKVNSLANEAKSLAGLLLVVMGKDDTDAEGGEA